MVTQDILFVIEVLFCVLILLGNNAIKLFPYYECSRLHLAHSVKVLRTYLFQQTPTILFNNNIQIPATSRDHALMFGNNCQSLALRECCCFQPQSETTKIFLASFYRRTISSKAHGFNERTFRHSDAIIKNENLSVGTIERAVNVNCLGIGSNTVVNQIGNSSFESIADGTQTLNN